jgi:error-prone DNA polymerase
VIPAYAELHCRSNFSFLEGASHPEELVERAAQLGYAALAITDECSVAGVVRAHGQAKASGLALILGSEVRLQGRRSGTAAAAGLGQPLRLVLLVCNREGWGNLCELITLGRRRAGKGEYTLHLHDLDAPDPGCEHLRGLPHCLALLIPERSHDEATLAAQARWLKAVFGERAWIAVEQLRWADDSLLVERLRAASQASGVPLVAAGAVVMHQRSRKPLHDTLRAIRLGKPLAECGFELARNAEQHLRARLQLAQLYHPEWLAQTLAIARLCRFSLDELRYEYPEEIVPAGDTPAGYLRRITYEGGARRYPAGLPEAVRAQIEHELVLIGELRFEAYFLTVFDIVQFARSRGILCQGRGSAANSAVCYCLHITEVDPSRSSLLFERFISKARGEPPDIDVDFEHERREEVIQYLYAKYGRHRAALAAALNTYRVRGALRDIGKALGVDLPRIDALAKSHQWFDGREQVGARFAEHGFDPEARLTRQWLELLGTLLGFPRHLSQHTGGFVIARDKLSRLVPIENAAMPERSVIQWDKDDLESLGLLKVDVLALGMLTALRRSLAFIAQRRGQPFAMQDVPREDPATYEMICRADTVGVFQIESRAQMSMLPRLQPRRFYDLVIEVAIVRPGPIQGGMVHPFLRRRMGREPVDNPYPALDAALGRTLGIPIFQEQVMQVCMIAAGFSADEADALRRAMAAWKRKGGLQHFQERIVAGMLERGYARAFAEAICLQIQGFGEYGFPESHAASFAELAYLSSWIKCHEPAAFLAALLNSQPMGFYAPAQLVQDAKRHDLVVRPVDAAVSDWDCTLEDAVQVRPAAPDAQGRPRPAAVRLGLRMVHGLGAEPAARLVAARAERPFADVVDLARRAALGRRELQLLAQADALASLEGHRRQQVWAVAPWAGETALLADTTCSDGRLDTAPTPEGEDILLDYAATGLTLRRHPMSLLRERIARRGWRNAEQLATLRNGQHAWACGIVTARQQPETAKGTIFVTLEDESGCVNIIVWPGVKQAQREALLHARLLAVHGQWQSQDGVQHLVARRLLNLTPWLGRLATVSRDFH